MRDIEIWVILVIGNLTELQKLVLQGELSCVTKSHMGQSHKQH